MMGDEKNEDKCGKQYGEHILEAKLVAVQDKGKTTKRMAIAIYHGKEGMLISKSTAMDLAGQLKKVLDKLI